MKSKKNGGMPIILLAYFIRYGYWLIMLILQYLIKSPYVLFVMIALYGAYFLIGLRFKFRHLYCGMQNAYHEHMRPNNSGCFTKEMKRDIIFIGCFFLIGGIIGILVTLFL